MSKEKVTEQLKTVMYPGFTKDIVSFGFVKNIDVSGENATIDLEITSSAPEVSQILTEEIRKKLDMIGIQYTKVNIKAPDAPKQEQPAQQTKNLAPSIKNFVMVSSGKGGVGKSTTTVNLAIASAMQGKKVGILDADIYGPNVPRMLGLEGQKPEVVDNKLNTLEAHGVVCMSMGSLIEPGQSLIWRGAMIIKTINQLLTDVNWGDLDILFIDMPPGTGDAQLTLAQSVPVTAGVVVTTPQTVALDDAKRGLDMFQKLSIPMGGIVENMSGFICPETNKEYDIFGKGTAVALAKEYNCDVLAEVPIEPAIREGGDSGNPITISTPSSETAKRYLKAADNLWVFLEEVAKSGGADNKDIQPVDTGKSACST